MSRMNDTDARLARLREKSRLLSSSMKDHEDRLNRISNSLAESYSSAQFTKSNRDSNAFRTSLRESINMQSNNFIKKLHDEYLAEQHLIECMKNELKNLRRQTRIQ